MIEGIEQHRDRLGLGQPLAEEPGRVGVGRRGIKIEAQKAEPTQSVPDQIFHPGIGHIVLRRQDQHLEHRQTVIGWAVTPCAVRIGKDILKDWAETFKVHNPCQFLQRIAVRRQMRQMI